MTKKVFTSKRMELTGESKRRVRLCTVSTGDEDMAGFLRSADQIIDRKRTKCVYSQAKIATVVQNEEERERALNTCR